MKPALEPLTTSTVVNMVDEAEALLITALIIETLHHTVVTAESDDPSGHGRYVNMGIVLALGTLYGMIRDKINKDDPRWTEVQLDVFTKELEQLYDKARAVAGFPTRQ